MGLTKGLGLGLVVILGFVACSKDSPSGGPPAVSFDVVDNLADSRPVEIEALPLTVMFVWSSEYFVLVNTAIELSTEECMKGRGFEYPVDPIVPEPYAWSVDSPFGPWTVDEVADDGYHRPSPALLLPETSKRDTYLGSLSQAEADAWFLALLGYISGGGPEGNRRPLTVELPDGRVVESGFREGFEQGCGYLGAQAIHGDYLRYEAFRTQVGALLEEAWDATLASDVVGQAVDAWSACMQSRGYDYESPKEPRHEFASRDLVSETELQTAAADVACKQEARLHDAWFVQKRAEELQIIEDNQLLITEWIAMRDRLAVRVASAATGG